MQPISCECDNNFDIDQPEDDESARTAMDPDVLDLKITGEPYSGWGKICWLYYRPGISPLVPFMAMDRTKANEFSFGFTFKQDTNDIQLTENSELEKAVICDDSWATAQYTNVNSTIHKGVYWYEVYYTNGQSDQYYQCDFMNNKEQGDYINAWALWQNDSNKKGTVNDIKRVYIRVAYEIDGQKDNGSNHQWTNWFYESKIYFEVEND